MHIVGQWPKHKCFSAFASEMFNPRKLVGETYCCCCVSCDGFGGSHPVQVDQLNNIWLVKEWQVYLDFVACVSWSVEARNSTGVCISGIPIMWPKASDWSDGAGDPCSTGLYAWILGQLWLQFNLDSHDLGSRPLDGWYYKAARCTHKPIVSWMYLGTREPPCTDTDSGPLQSLCHPQLPEMLHFFHPKDKGVCLTLFDVSSQAAYSFGLVVCLLFDLEMTVPQGVTSVHLISCHPLLPVMTSSFLSHVSEKQQCTSIWQQCLPDSGQPDETPNRTLHSWQNALIVIFS